jgi:hypothetical protein
MTSQNIQHTPELSPSQDDACEKEQTKPLQKVSHGSCLLVRFFAILDLNLDLGFNGSELTRKRAPIKFTEKHIARIG